MSLEYLIVILCSLPHIPPVPGQQSFHQQVLGTLFDILISHYRMAKYHEESLAASQAPEAGAAASDQEHWRLHQGPCSSDGVLASQSRTSDSVSSPQVSRAT